MFPPICIKVFKRTDYEPVIKRNDTKTDNKQLGSTAYFAQEEFHKNMKKKATLVLCS